MVEPDSLVTEDPSTQRAAPEPRPLAVLQVLPGLVAGGVERGTIDVAAALVASGWSAYVASSGGPMVRELVRAGATHIELPLHSKNPWVMYRNIERLAGLIRAHDIDVVHARSRAPAWSAFYAAKRTDARFVTTIHGAYDASGPFKRLYGNIMARGERVIAISDFIGERAVAVHHADPARVRVIHRGIDLDVYDPNAVSPERMIQLTEQWRLPDDAPVILLPGRLTRLKGHETLIEAVARLERRDLRCIIVGSSAGRAAYKAELESEVKRLGIEPVVQLVENCNDMPAAYMLSDAVVSASTAPEAFGRVAVEAQALGRPVIATDHGGARETVLDGETGWLVPPGDAASLAEALRAALALDGEARETLARRAVAHVRAHYAKTEMCQHVLDVYAELLELSG